MAIAPRVAFFTDSFTEINGVALTSRQLDAFARRRDYPFLTVHAGAETLLGDDRVMLARGGASFPIERGQLSFDLFFMRHRATILKALKRFRADLIHITGPSDVGILGAWAANKLKIPLVASWHTNLHEFGAKRLEKLLHLSPQHRISNMAERGILESCARFYRLARVLLAPNPDLIEMLKKLTRREVFLMRRGVDTGVFHPGMRTRSDDAFVLGYCGRIAPEKSVRFLADIQRAIPSVKFLVIGDGGEREWLQHNLADAEFPGVLKGDALARAYANMDLFVFPSRTDTYGNVVQEALASGVPCVVTAEGGPKYLIAGGATGFIAADDAAFIDAVRRIVNDRDLHARMRAAAREHALTLSWDRVFEEVFDVYRHVTAPQRFVQAG